MSDEQDYPQDYAQRQMQDERYQNMPMNYAATWRGKDLTVPSTIANVLREILQRLEAIEADIKTIKERREP